MKIVRGLAALLVLGALLVGAPLALNAWGDLGPLLDLTWRSFTQPVHDPRLLVGLVTLVGWWAWAALLVSFGCEVVTTLTRGRWRPAVPGLRWLQPLVGVLVAAVIAMLAVSGRAASPVGDAPAPPAVVQTVATTGSASPQHADDVDDDLHHRVEPGDELWTLAERYYGSGERWTTIAAANDLAADQELPAGAVLRLPGVPRPVLPTKNEAAPRTAERTPEHLSAADQGAFTDDPVRLVAGSMTTLLAAAVAARLVVRRREALVQRPLGRRLLPVSDAATRYESALSRLAAQPDASGALEPDLDPSPTSVVLGSRDDGTSVVVDLAQHDRLLVTGDRELAQGLLGGIVTSLCCAPWSQGTRVVVGGEALAWVDGLDHALLQVMGAEDAWQLAVNEAALRSEGDAAVASDEPVVVVLAEPPQGVLPPAPGLSLVVASPRGEADGVHVIDDTRAIWQGEAFWPQVMAVAARRALIELHAAVAGDETRPAPWWEDDPPPNVHQIHPTPVIPREEEAMIATEHPKLLLLGPVTLVGARGVLPNRAIKQCEEYCGWLLENPGRTAAVMTQSLLVAETTRRSNMSRLRQWLGATPTGEPYLPDAYSGRIALHPAVTSDWDDLQVLVAGGVNRMTNQALVEALELVRGEPLADVAPGQWTWAEEWRSDMISIVRDVAVVLARRCTEGGDHDEARWAIDRGLVAAPGDELLLAAKLRLERVMGNQPEVDRLVIQITRDARRRGVDLLDETVQVIQEVIEGRARSRRA